MKRRQEELLTVNRGAVILQPTEDYLHWAKNTPDPLPELTLDTLREESPVYLMPKFEFTEDAEQWLRSNYRSMFVEGLRSWCTDEDSWPKDLSYETFRGFFNAHITSLVFDLDKGSLRRES